MIRSQEAVASKRASSAPEAERPVPAPSLGELPPLEEDDYDIPVVDRPSAYAFDDEGVTPILNERDAVEGPAVDDLIDEIDEAADSGDEGDPLDESFGGSIDEAPDGGALGDDDDGLGNDASDLDDSLLESERADDGADGVDRDLVDLDEPHEPLDREAERGDEAEDPIVLPPLPDLHS